MLSELYTSQKVYFIGEPESMEVEKWEEDEEVAMDVDMDKASMIEMFDSVSVTEVFHDSTIVTRPSAKRHQSFVSD